MSSDKHFIAIHDVRRKAPLHFWAKADNARFTAFLMQKDDEIVPTAAEEISYGGAPGIARREAFLREAAISLELIIKAAIAQRIESGESESHVAAVKASHNIPALWEDAGLPPLSKADRRLLIFVRRILLWSGRYAAPRDDAKYLKDRAEENALIEKQTKPGLLNLRKGTSFGWNEFDRLYKIAFSEFERSRIKLETSFGDFL